jgi:hypothetical protein
MLNAKQTVSRKYFSLSSMESSHEFHNSGIHLIGCVFILLIFLNLYSSDGLPVGIDEDMIQYSPTLRAMFCDRNFLEVRPFIFCIFKRNSLELRKLKWKFSRVTRFKRSPAISNSGRVIPRAPQSTDLKCIRIRQWRCC